MERLLSESETLRQRSRRSGGRTRRSPGVSRRLARASASAPGPPDAAPAAPVLAGHPARGGRRRDRPRRRVAAVDRAGTPILPYRSDDRIKGLRPALTIYRRTAAGTETLADGSVARPGDLLRVGYTARGTAYGVILSIDGARSVTLHLPPEGDAPRRCRSDRGHVCSTRPTSSTTPRGGNGSIS